MSDWITCEWCHARNAATQPEAEAIRNGSGCGAFGRDVVCPECEAAYWSTRIDMDRAVAAGRAIARAAREEVES